MTQLLKVAVIIGVILVSNILCDTRSNVHYEKCLEYRAEEKNSNINISSSLVLVEVLAVLRVGIVISQDTILIIVIEVPNEQLTSHSFKVYLKGGYTEWYTPELFFTKDRFILLKMSELSMKLFPRRRACLLSELPELHNLHIVSIDAEHNLNIVIAGSWECLSHRSMTKPICISQVYNLAKLSNNSVLLYFTPEQMNIIGIYVKDEFPMVQLIGEKYIKWIGSITWSDPTTNGVQRCGQVKLPLEPFITFGMSTTPGEFPWHAAILKNGDYICGGTIINPRAIVTAAHCVQNQLGIISAESLTIMVGLYNIVNYDAQSQLLQVQSIIPHEHFDMEYFENDIAVVRVAENIVYTNFVQSICMQSIAQQNATEGVVPGWGKDELGNNRNILQKGSLFVQSTKACRQTNRGYFRQYLTESNFCAGYKNGTNVCSGDSGGGLVVMDHHAWILRGVVSLGKIIPIINRCDVTHLVLFTNATYFYHWIMDKSG